MLTCRSNIGSVIAVFLGQRAGKLGPDRFGIGDDAADGLAQNRCYVTAYTAGSLPFAASLWRRVRFPLLRGKIKLETGASGLWLTQGDEIYVPASLRTRNID